MSDGMEILVVESLEDSLEQAKCDVVDNRLIGSPDVVLANEYSMSRPVFVCPADVVDNPLGWFDEEAAEQLPESDVYILEWDGSSPYLSLPGPFWRNNRYLCDNLSDDGSIVRPTTFIDHLKDVMTAMRDRSMESPWVIEAEPFPTDMAQRFAESHKILMDRMARAFMVPDQTPWVSARIENVAHDAGEYRIGVDPASPEGDETALIIAGREFQCVVADSELTGKPGIVFARAYHPAYCMPSRSRLHGHYDNMGTYHMRDCDCPCCRSTGGGVQRYTANPSGRYRFFDEAANMEPVPDYSQPAAYIPDHPKGWFFDESVDLPDAIDRANKSLELVGEFLSRHDNCAGVSDVRLEHGE